MNFTSAEIRTHSALHRNKAIVLIATMSVVLSGFFYFSGSAHAASPEIASVLSQAPASDVGKKTMCAYCGMQSSTPSKSGDRGCRYASRQVRWEGLLLLRRHGARRFRKNSREVSCEASIGRHNARRELGTLSARAARV
jgi:hypothetical protein